MAGAIVHADDIIRKSESDNEVIKVDLLRLPPEVKELVFTVNSFHGKGFSKVDNVYLRVVDEASDQELMRFSITNETGKGAINSVMAKLYRDRENGGWMIHALGAQTLFRHMWDDPKNDNICTPAIVLVAICCAVCSTVSLFCCDVSLGTQLFLFALVPVLIWGGICEYVISPIRIERSTVRNKLGPWR